jgi:hypothetical protein
LIDRARTVGPLRVVQSMVCPSHRPRRDGEPQPKGPRCEHYRLRGCFWLALLRTCRRAAWRAPSLWTGPLRRHGMPLEAKGRACLSDLHRGRMTTRTRADRQSRADRARTRAGIRLEAERTLRRRSGKLPRDRSGMRTSRGNTRSCSMPSPKQRRGRRGWRGGSGSTDSATPGQGSSRGRLTCCRSGGVHCARRHVTRLSVRLALARPSLAWLGPSGASEES